MPRSNIQKRGNIRDDYPDGIAIQPDRTITEKNDGTLEGIVNFECDRADFLSLPQMGAAHPDDHRLELYNRDITYSTLGKVKLSGAYFGLVARKTEPVLAYTPNTDRDPIETHPLFDTFAGTKASPINGAKFDKQTGEFLGFFNQAIKDLFGAKYYLVPSTMVALTYWTSVAPSLSKRMTIIQSVPGFRKPPDVKDFLLLDMPYRQIGSFYQVTEQIMGSGPLGWSKKIYG